MNKLQPHTSIPPSDTPKDTRLGFAGVTSFTVANMIGTGVFTTLGFQLLDLHTPFALLALWIVGGLIALCGSLVYGELGAAMPRSGGEYHYLSVIYHPAVGFLSGFVSLTIGFAAPVALACMALGHYTEALFPEGITAQMIAVAALVLITTVHMWSVRGGSRFQNVFTLLKLALIVAFVVCGIVAGGDKQPFLPVPDGTGWREMLSPAFAVCLIYVSYAYSGWNASAYVAGEVRDPQRTLPRSLLWGVAIVAVAYVALNATFLSLVPHEEMRGKLQVGFIAAQHLFGPTGAGLMAGVIGLLLVSSISSMIFVGPRVSQVMGEDYRLFRFLSHRSRRGTPAVAVAVQSCISLLFILSGSFEQVVTFSGFILSMFTFLSVLGVFVHRRRYPEAERPYKTWGYPVTPILFLLLTGWTMVFLLVQKTSESVLGIFTLGIGLGAYAVCRWWDLRTRYKAHQASDHLAEEGRRLKKKTSDASNLTRNSKKKTSDASGMMHRPKDHANNPRIAAPDRSRGGGEASGGMRYKEERSKSMVITYNDPEDAADAPKRELDDREKEYFRRYRSDMQELLYGYDSHQEEADTETADERAETDWEHMPIMDTLIRFGIQEAYFKPGLFSNAVRFSLRLIHFLKAGENGEPGDDRRSAKHRQALIRELEHPNPEVRQVADDFFYSPEGSLEDLLRHLVDFCRSQNHHERRTQHPFRRGDISEWADSPTTRSHGGGIVDGGFMGPHMN